jgi:putative FmdB family regulatory protein
MPNYDYKCRTCDLLFTIVSPMNECHERAACPVCKLDTTLRVFGGNVVTSESKSSDTNHDNTSRPLGSGGFLSVNGSSSVTIIGHQSYGAGTWVKARGESRVTARDNQIAEAAVVFDFSDDATLHDENTVIE